MELYETNDYKIPDFWHKKTWYSHYVWFVLSVVDVVKIVIYTSKDCSVIITSSKAILVQVLDFKII